MKQVSAFLFFVLICLMACSKKPATVKSPLEGTWKLTEVLDGGLPYLSQPPGEVVITFTANGIYSGHTLANLFSDGKFVVQDSNRITFDLPRIQTQVAEEEWGRGLFVVLASCGLQSVHPCRPCNYSITGNELFIDSPMRYDLILKKQ